MFASSYYNPYNLGYTHPYGYGYSSYNYLNNWNHFGTTPLSYGYGYNHPYDYSAYTYTYSAYGASVLPTAPAATILSPRSYARPIVSTPLAGSYIL